MELTTAELQLIEQRVTNRAQSTGVAYLLWFFGWFVSGHRFYLQRPGSAILQILSYFILIGFLWVIIDAFLIPSMVRWNKDLYRQRMIDTLRAEKAEKAGVPAERG